MHVNIEGATWSRRLADVPGGLARMAPAHPVKSRFPGHEFDHSSISRVSIPLEVHQQPDSSCRPDASTFGEPARTPAAHKAQIILVPTDFTPSSLLALDFALKIALKGGALVTLLHAVNLNLDPYGPANIVQMKALLGQEARKKAEPMLICARRVGITATCLVEEGAPAQVITKVARQCHAVMIVLASSRRGILARLFSHGTVKKVVREAECPVLVLQTDSNKGKYHE